MDNSGLVENSKKDELEKGNLYESTSKISFNFDQLQQLLQLLVRYLKRTTNFKVEVTYNHGFLGKLIGDIPYLNHIHFKSSKIKGLLIKLQDKEFKIDLSDVIKYEIVECDEPNSAIEIKSVPVDI